MPWRRTLLTVLGGFLLVYGVAYADLLWRARSAFYEGEKYMAWNQDPSLKKAALDAGLARTEKRLRDQAATEGWAAEVLRERLFLAKFEREERMNESSLKYAYAWYQTAAVLFTPPESRWVALCRERGKTAQALWKKELDARKIRTQDFMLE